MQQAIQGMRGVKALVTETSELDVNEGFYHCCFPFVPLFVCNQNKLRKKK